MTSTIPPTIVPLITVPPTTVPHPKKLKTEDELLEAYYAEGEWAPTTIPCSVPFVLTVMIYGVDVSIRYTRQMKCGEAAFVYEAQVCNDDSPYFGTKVVLKFTQSYCATAHKLLAGDELAPALHSVINLQGDWKLVVMEMIEGAMTLHQIRALQTSQRSVIMQDVGKAINKLHEHGFVHGDIRVPNVLVTKEPLRAYIIDFDFTGMERIAIYPMNLDLGIFTWVEFEEFPLILKKHDILALQEYSKHIRATE